VGRAEPGYAHSQQAGLSVPHDRARQPEENGPASPNLERFAQT
jgi:hypothetical protein